MPCSRWTASRRRWPTTSPTSCARRSEGAVPFSWGRGGGDGRAETARSVALFTVACGEYAIAAARVRHLVPAGREPRRSIVFEGATYPLIALRAVFRLRAGPRPGRVRPMDDGAGRTAALMVDGVGTMARLEQRALTALPPVFRGHERVRFEALALLEDRIVIVIAPCQRLEADALVAA